MTELAELFEGLLVPLRAVLVAVIGVWLAWQWSGGTLGLPIVIISAVIVIGYGFDVISKNLLPSRPVVAVILLEFWILAPLMAAAAASALIVVLSIGLAVPENASTASKELTKAVSTALTAFLTAGVIAWTGDQAESPLARRIQRSFAQKYQRCIAADLREPGIQYFAAGSAGERWVQSDAYGGVEGWGHPARLARARGIAEELRTHRSDCP